MTASEELDAAGALPHAEGPDRALSARQERDGAGCSLGATGILAGRLGPPDASVVVVATRRDRGTGPL